MADQVPGSFQVLGTNPLHFPLLHAVLPKVPYSRLESFLNRDGRMCLRDSDQGDFVGTAGGARCGGSDSFLDITKILSYRRHRLQSTVYSHWEKGKRWSALPNTSPSLEGLT